MFDRDRLQAERERLHSDWVLRNDKLARLGTAYTIETDTAEKFKLEAQIKAEEAIQAQLSDRLHEIETALNLNSPISSPPLPNPFIPLSGRVEDPAQFFEPQGVINSVFETLNSGSSVALIGERGMGKSSILKAIERLAPMRLQRKAIYLDWYFIDNEDSFWDQICDEIDVVRHDNYLLTKALKSCDLLLLMDQVAIMNDREFGLKIRQRLRGYAEGSSMKIVTAAPVALDLLFADDYKHSTSPFAGLFVNERIPCWNESMMRSYIAQRLAGNPIQFTAPEIENIIQTCKDRPQQLVVQRCNNLYRQYRDRHESR
jgi:energy-coupling factor transporter ATP-binding protein EcfA2